jgi:thiamine-phosphate pyrophosphorylase
LGAIFIIDDMVEVAQEIGADGVHIGKDDISLTEARKIFTNGFIGLSCYGDLERAVWAQNNGCDYVAFGSFFTSITKPLSSKIPLDILKEAKDRLSIPICAIGGINIDNISLVSDCKPDMISVISAIFGDDNIELNVKNLLDNIRL